MRDPSCVARGDAHHETFHPDAELVSCVGHVECESPMSTVLSTVSTLCNRSQPEVSFSARRSGG